MLMNVDANDYESVVLFNFIPREGGVSIQIGLKVLSLGSLEQQVVLVVVKTET